MNFEVAVADEVMDKTDAATSDDVFLYERANTISNLDLASYLPEDIALLKE